MNPERRVQPKFSFRRAAAALALLAAIGLFDRWLASIPDRQELGWRALRIDRRPVAFEPGAFAPFRLAGAWQLTSDDPRFGAVSALALDDGRFVALSDWGDVISFAPAGGSARIGELPGGPASSRFKVNRDSEALVADPQGRGWWVAFENRDELWLYDRQFNRALQRVRLGDRRWKVNRGIEGAVRDGESLLLLHESGDSLLRVTGHRARAMRIAGARARLSDAVELGDGQWLVIERQFTPSGFRNALVMLEREGEGYRFGRRFSLPVGRLDNVEAIALQRLAGGRRRLWLMTDDNLDRRLRTLLIALDMPPLDHAASGLGERLTKN
jgi:hypothetical protein